MKIAVAGAGYVGLSLAVMLSQYYEVYIYDINKEKVALINQGISPIADVDIQYFLREKSLNLRATTNFSEAFIDSKYVFVATPSDYVESIQRFDTTSLEDVVEKVLAVNKNSQIVIKSTVPIGFTRYLKEKHKTNNIIFSPEFLREGFALHDQLYPSRIIIGEKSQRGEILGQLLRDATESKNAPILLTGSDEAEAIKLFSNAYLALRIAFFNELDTFSEVVGLNSREIIEGMGLDPRIGNFYNNPSFGYGGYCLPKDVKQLRTEFENFGINGLLISAITNSNQARKDYVIQKVLSKNVKIVGIYRLTSKHRGDNFRYSVSLHIVKELIKNELKVIIYEPLLKNLEALDLPKEAIILNNLEQFKKESELILANRVTEELVDVMHKVYSRDLYHRD